MHRSSRLRPRAQLALLIGLATAVSSAMAGIYRWTDAQGVTHYSQTPPPSGEADRIVPQGPAVTTESIGDAANALLERADLRDQREREEVEQREARLAEAAPKCEDARKRLAFLESRPPSRIQVVGDDGAVSRMTEDQWNNDKAAERQRVEQYCG